MPSQDAQRHHEFVSVLNRGTGRTREALIRTVQAEASRSYYVCGNNAMFDYVIGLLHDVIFPQFAPHIKLVRRGVYRHPNGRELHIVFHLQTPVVSKTWSPYTITLTTSL